MLFVGLGVGSANSVTFFDSFDRPDSSVLGNGWSEDQGDLLISNGELKNNLLIADHMAVLPQMSGATQIVSADFASADNNFAPRFGVVLRFQDARNYYLFYRLVGGSSLLCISKIVNGTETVLAKTSIPNPSKNTFFRLGGRAELNKLTLELNGVAKLSISDSTFAAGSLGIHIRSSKSGVSHRADNFSATVTGGGPINQAPIVNAGPDQAISLPGSADLSGTVSDDGLPDPPGIVTTSWSKVSGPGTVSFANASALVTTVSFSTSGTYVLRLTANDGALSVSDDIRIMVISADTSPPTVSLTAPPNNAIVSNTITVSATASDNIGVVGVQFRLDGQDLGPEDTSTPYSVLWDTRAVSDGMHTLTAIARDQAGNTKTSSPVVVTVSNGSPSATYQGFGASTPGGTGKPVYHVTNLKDSGAGSLRDAVSQGNRMIVFDVAGEILLSSEITVRGSFLTIDGLTAPAPGITVKNRGLIIRNVHDVIVRGLRIRNAAQDGIWVTDASYNIVIDHVSVHNSGDGNIDITRVNTRDITVSWSILAEPAGEEKNMLLAFKMTHITLHHNLFINSSQRNPQVTYDDSSSYAQDTTTTLDMRNNLIWNWRGGYGTRIRYGGVANVVNNYYAADGGDAKDALVVCRGSTSDSQCYNDPNNKARAFVHGNVSKDGVNIDAEGNVAVPFPAPTVDITDARTAACQVFKGAGVRPLDVVDQGYLATVSLPFCP